MKHPNNPELLENLRLLNHCLEVLAELQVLPQTDMVLHRTILATRQADAALQNVQAWRDAQLACVRLDTVH